MKYYVKIDEEFREYPTRWEAHQYNEVIQGDGVFYSSGNDEQKAQMIIDSCVDRYMAKKTRHIEVQA